MRGRAAINAPVGALNRTSGPALLAGGHRFGHQAPTPRKMRTIYGRIWNPPLRYAENFALRPWKSAAVQGFSGGQCQPLRGFIPRKTQTTKDPAAQNKLRDLLFFLKFQIALGVPVAGGGHVGQQAVAGGQGVQHNVLGNASIVQNQRSVEKMLHILNVMRR